MWPPSVSSNSHSAGGPTDPYLKATAVPPEKTEKITIPCISQTDPYLKPTRLRQPAEWVDGK